MSPSEKSWIRHCWCVSAQISNRVRWHLDLMYKFQVVVFDISVSKPREFFIVIIFDILIFYGEPLAYPRGAPGMPPPIHTAQNVLNFMQFFWKIWQNRMLVPPPGRLPPPPTGNPGSDTRLTNYVHVYLSN